MSINMLKLKLAAYERMTPIRVKVILCRIMHALSNFTEEYFDAKFIESATNLFVLRFLYCSHSIRKRIFVHSPSITAITCCADDAPQTLTAISNIDNCRVKKHAHLMIYALVLLSGPEQLAFCSDVFLLIWVDYRVFQLNTTDEIEKKKTQIISTSSILSK